MSPPALTEQGCRQRQDRLRRLLAEKGLAGAVISAPQDIHYFSGYPIPVLPRFPAILYIAADGPSWLASPGAEAAFVDQSAKYEGMQSSPLNPDPMRRMARLVEKGFGRQARRVGWQSETLPHVLAEAFTKGLHADEWAPIDDGLTDMQSRKDADEVALLRESIACTLSGYDAVKAAIRPGVNELAVLEAGHAAANLRAGEIVYYGGEHQSGEKGGAARNRNIRDGELYIVDSNTVFRGYWSDLCRTFAVGETTPLQREVFAHIAAILADLPAKLKPGAKGAELWRWMDERIRQHPHLRDVGLPHHVGHGIGTRSHEPPLLLRGRDDVLQPGNVVSCEPGSYTPELNAGVRIENTFLITESGCELLSDYPVALA